MKKGAGRPDTYTSEIGDKIMALVMEGQSINAITQRDDMPSKATFYNWILKHRELLDKYEKALEYRTHGELHKMFEIADYEDGDMIIKEDGTQISNSVKVQRDRLRIDMRKWALARMNPRKYGDKIDMTTKGNEIQQVVIPSDIYAKFNDSTEEDSQ